MAKLAIVIPFLGDTQRLEETLVSVLENRPPDAEVLVVLCQPYANPYQLEDEVHFVPGPDQPGWASALNHGTAAAHAPWIHVLGCGATVEEGWVEPALTHFQDGTIAAVAPMVSETPGGISAGMSYDPRGAITPCRPPGPCPNQNRPGPMAPHWAAAFYRKSAWEAAGRFATDVGDWLVMLDFALTLSALGLRTAVEPRCLVRLPASATSPGAFRRACDAERFYWRWAGLRGPRLLAAHARLVAADCLAGLADRSLFARLAGRLIGLAGFRASAAHRLRLAALHQGCVPLPAPASTPRLASLRPNGASGVSATPNTAPLARTIRSMR